MEGESPAPHARFTRNPRAVHLACTRDGYPVWVLGLVVARASRLLAGCVVGLAIAGTSLVAGCTGTETTPRGGSPQAAQVLPPLPHGWPTSLQLGMADSPGGTVAMAATAPFGLRYQYLAGGLDDGWRKWVPAGSFVAAYIDESRAAGMLPVFSYYMLLQSTPDRGSEGERLATALTDTGLMRRYLEDLEAFFDQATGKGTVVLHVEPDFWGFMQQLAGNDAARLPARVSATGVTSLGGLPDTVAGLAQAIVRLRDRIAPNVLLAYHLSRWATGSDYVYEDPPASRIDLAASAVFAFYRSLGAPFDLVFAEASDRDAGYNQVVRKDGGASWWDEQDYRNDERFLADFVALSGLRVVLWQVPYGNTLMRALDNSPGHYQDNHVEWLLGDLSGEHLSAYVQSGVIAILFGRGSAHGADASDAEGDGVTDPAPIGSNERLSLSADDDGGYFRERAAAYYAARAMPLTGAEATRR